MALEQNRGSRKPHGELLKEKTEKAKEIEAGKRASYIVTLPEEKKETKRKIDNLDVLQMNTARDIEGELDEVYSKKEKRKKSLWKKILLLSVIEILTLVMIVCAGYVVRYMNIKPEVQFNIKNVKNQNIDVTKQEQMPMCSLLYVLTERPVR